MAGERGLYRPRGSLAGTGQQRTVLYRLPWQRHRRVLQEFRSAEVRRVVSWWCPAYGKDGDVVGLGRTSGKGSYTIKQYVGQT